MTLGFLVLSILLISAWGQPSKNAKEYASSKFFIGVPNDTAPFILEQADTYSLVNDDQEYRELVRPKPGAVYQNIGFVKPDGNRFSVNGKPFSCAGTNAFYAGLEYIMSQEEVVNMMLQQKNQGSSVLRIFASFFDSVPER